MTRLIDADALREALKSNCKPELCHDYNTAWCEHCCRTNDFEDLIDDAPTVELFCSYLSDGEVRQPCVEAPCSHERPQGKWFDCLTKGLLKARHGDYVVYNVDYLLDNLTREVFNMEGARRMKPVKEGDINEE